jgi:hypothetical protein
MLLFHHLKIHHTGQVEGDNDFVKYSGTSDVGVPALSGGNYDTYDCGCSPDEAITNPTCNQV